MKTAHGLRVSVRVRTYAGPLQTAELPYDNLSWMMPYLAGWKLHPRCRSIRSGCPLLFRCKCRQTSPARLILRNNEIIIRDADGTCPWPPEGVNG
jgi:hypothetical protein